MQISTKIKLIAIGIVGLLSSQATFAAVNTTSNANYNDANYNDANYNDANYNDANYNVGKTNPMLDPQAVDRTTETDDNSWTYSGGKGITISTDGGLRVDANNGYWFAFNGVFKLDGGLFLGSARSRGTQFRNGLNIRDATIDFTGGLGPDLSYVFEYSMAGDANTRITDAYLTYSGFAENFTVSVGQVNPGFGLENISSSKWLPFLERAMDANTLAADQGLGVAVNKWGDRYSFNASLITATEAPENTNAISSNLLSPSGRLTYAPIMNKDAAKILQVGISGHYEPVTTALYSAVPEATGMSLNDIVLNTGTMNVKALSTFAGDIAIQNGPLYMKGEYRRVHVARAVNFTRGSLGFSGYHVLAAYVLTGEHRTFSAQRGVFGQIIPDSKCGAVEVGARYSYLNLNSKEINGGSAHNATLGINWYLNTHIKIAADYIRSNQRGAGENFKRMLNIFGARFQFVF